MISAASQLAAAPVTRAMVLILLFLMRHPGFHALGALGLDVEALDEFEAVPRLIARGWVGDINGMFSITAEGLTVYLALRRRAAEKACRKNAELVRSAGHA